VLGSVLLDNDLAIDMLAGLKREELYLDAHRKIYTAIVELVNEGSPIETLSLANKLGRRRRWNPSAAWLT
jgi:replicative DNA helicase